MFIPTDISTLCLGSGENLLLCARADQPCAQLMPCAHQAQAVYIDPPFMTGAAFRRKRPFGEKGWRSGSPAPAYPGYADRWSKGEYLALLRGLIENAHLLLADTGVFALHLDWRASAWGRLLCDEVFGEELFLNEVVWAYESGGRAKTHFPRKHDTILLYARTPKYRFRLDQVPIPRTGARSNHMRRGVDEDGRGYGAITVGGKEYRYYDDEPAYPSDVWTDISHLQQRDPERLGYETQKPLKLLERVLRPLVEPGDLVADLCCGSGTTLHMAHQLGCRFIGVDSSAETISLCQHRLQMAPLRVIAPCTAAEAPLRGDFDAQTGRLTLRAFEAAHPSFPSGALPLDALESFAIGTLGEGGVLTAQALYARSRKSPALPEQVIWPDAAGAKAILTVDAAGRRRGYLVEEG